MVFVFIKYWTLLPIGKKGFEVQKDWKTYYAGHDFLRKFEEHFGSYLSGRSTMASDTEQLEAYLTSVTVMSNVSRHWPPFSSVVAAVPWIENNSKSSLR